MRTGNIKRPLERERGVSRSTDMSNIPKYGLDRAGAAEAPGNELNPEASAT